MQRWPNVLRIAVRPTAAVVFVMAMGWGTPGLGAASGPGTRPVGGVPALTSVSCGGHRPPVDAPVVDEFRLPDGHYGAGNRGLEYATTPGEPVRAIGAGEVTFAGAVAGRIAVSIRHADGRLSSLTGLASAVVRRGELVARGTVVGTAGALTHLGVREGTRYVDPAPLLCSGRRRAVLVPGPP